MSDGANLSRDDVPLRRAAQYIRMSTQQQAYSPQNQADAIAAYALKIGYEVVRTYADEGKSGLTYDGREALQRLISDIQSGAPGFDTVIVYDVSRWGRFQDADESAHYEFLCRRAGVRVLYCHEPFENDGSPVSTVVKGLKRAMAGEYSRELGEKVRAGKRRAAGMGFYQSGPPGYGLRRMLVDEHRKPKGVLVQGQRKAVSTDRIILVPGPDEEVLVVNKIYRMLVDDDMSLRAISRTLNAKGIPATGGRRWNKESITTVLTREKYIGHLTYGRTRRRLKGVLYDEPRTNWVVAENAFEPIISKELFDAAQVALEGRRSDKTAAQIIARLSSLKERYGYITSSMVAADPTLPSIDAVVRRFGRLVNAYHLAGYHPNVDRGFVKQGRKAHKLQIQLCRAIRRRIVQVGGTFEADPGNYNGPVLVNGLFSIAIKAIRCERDRQGSLRWRIKMRGRSPADILLLGRIQPDAAEFKDYILIPEIEQPHSDFILRDRIDGPLRPYVNANIEPLLSMVRRSLVSEVTT
jgi:DNA invertase Pin-like site-specific DNA recombinase